MTEGGHEKGQPEPQIRIESGQFAGVWANFVRVSHSPYEFTLDFARLDLTMVPPQGIVVARVSLSPLLVTQLIEALDTNWRIYAERSMPSEVREHDRTTDEGDAGIGPAGSSP